MAKTFTLEPTRDKDLFRVVDRDGNWNRYLHQPTNTYLDAVSAVLEKGFAKGASLLKYYKQLTEKEIDERFNAAAEKGSRIHRAIETILNKEVDQFTRDTLIYNRTMGVNERLSNEEWDSLLTFVTFWDAHKPQVVAVETSVYNTKYKYAGTLDAILILTQACEARTCQCRNIIGKIGIWDWKTGSGIWRSYGAQVAAYGNAPSIKSVLGKHKPEYTAILRIGADRTLLGYQMEVYNKEETHRNWELYLAAATIAADEMRTFNPAREVYEIPDIIQLTVEYKKLTAEKKKKNVASTNSPSDSASGVLDGQKPKAAAKPKRKALQTGSDSN